MARSTASKNCGVGSEGMDRIAWIRTENDIAGRGNRLRHIGKAFLGAQSRDDLGLRIEFHAEASVVIGRLRLAQAVDAARGRVAVGPRPAQRLLQLLNDMRRRRQVRIAHAEINDVGPGIARGRLGPVDLLEDVRRQAANAVEIVHGSSAPASVRQNRKNRKAHLHRKAIAFSKQNSFSVQKSCPINDLARVQGKLAGFHPNLRLNVPSYHGRPRTPAIYLAERALLRTIIWIWRRNPWRLLP